MAGTKHFTRFGIATRDDAVDRRDQHQVVRRRTNGRRRGRRAAHLGRGRYSAFNARSLAHESQGFTRRVTASGCRTRRTLHHVKLLPADVATRRQRRQSREVSRGAFGVGVGRPEFRFGTGDFRWSCATIRLARHLARRLESRHRLRFIGGQRWRHEHGDRIARAHRVPFAHEHANGARRLQRPDIHFDHLEGAHGTVGHSGRSTGAGTRQQGRRARAGATARRTPRKEETREETR